MFESNFEIKVRPLKKESAQLQLLKLTILTLEQTHGRWHFSVNLRPYSTLSLELDRKWRKHFLTLFLNNAVGRKVRSRSTLSVTVPSLISYHVLATTYHTGLNVRCSANITKYFKYANVDMNPIYALRGIVRVSGFIAPFKRQNSG